MKLRSFIAAVLTFWLIVGPVGTALAASGAAPCESMGAMSQALPHGDCCGDTMDAASCLSACLATSSVAAALEQQTTQLQLAGSSIPGRSLRYATLLAPPDIAPPKTFVS